jgi:hypothetical protein
MIDTLPDEPLDETEQSGIVRLRELLDGRWFDIRRRIDMGD